MGGLGQLNAARIVSDSGLLRTPDSVANLEQEPTVQEMYNQAGVIGQYGGLDFLFEEPPYASVPTPLETPGTPGISPQLLSRIQDSGELTNTYAYQPRADENPGGPVVNQQPGWATGPAEPVAPTTRWTFTDTLKREVVKFQDYVGRVLNRGGGGTDG